MQSKGQKVVIETYILVMIDDAKGLDEFFFSVSLSNLGSHHLHKLLKFYGPTPIFVHISNHLFYLLNLYKYVSAYNTD